MTFLQYVLLIQSLLSQVLCFWPPPYEIKLDQSETFVISPFEDQGDELFSDEDEMIQQPSIPDNNIDENRLFRLHQIVHQQNKRDMATKKPRKNVTKWPEENIDKDEPIPWEARFINKNGSLLQPDNENVFYFNEMAKDLINSKIQEKREEENVETSTKEDYDYNNFKLEYEKEITNEKNTNETANLTDIKEDESFKDAVNTILKFNNVTKNCTEEERVGIGFSAIKCILSDLRRPHSKSTTLNLIEKILKIALFWFVLYAIIAIPCWCQRGWCCCCCCCRVCQPRRTIDEAKKFFVENPVGLYHTKDKKIIQYQPTHYETYAQKKLEKALFTL